MYGGNQQFPNQGNRRNNKEFRPTVYTQYRFSNSKSEVDQTQMQFQYWGNLFRWIISPKTPESPAEQPMFDFKNSISIYLNYAKARVWAEVLKGFLADPDAWDNASVTAGGSLITVTKGEEYSSKYPLIIIRTIDPDSGSITSSYAYEIRGNHYYAIKNFKESNKDYEREFFVNMEIEMMITMLEEFYKGETRGAAYAIIDANRFNQNYLTQRINKVGEKLGLDMNSLFQRNGGGGYRNYSFFSENGDEGDGGSYSGGGGRGGKYQEDDYSAYTPASLDDL